MELITYETKIHEANISEIEVDYDMNEPDTGITSSHYSNNKAWDTKGFGTKPEIVIDNFFFSNDLAQRIKVGVTLFLFILEALKTDQDTLKRWDHLKRCICSVPALWELIHTSMLFTSQLIKLSRDLERFWKKISKLIL